MSTRTMRDKFEKCIKRKVRKSELEIKCVLGLWSVFGQDASRVETEARHYWIQYFNDDEYKDLLK